MKPHINKVNSSTYIQGDGVFQAGKSSGLFRMKTYCSLCLAFLCLLDPNLLCGAPAATSQPAQTKDVPAPTPYAVTVRDANSRVWEQTVYELDSSGQVVPKKHSYTELATGLHYQKAGQWVDAKEWIDILPNGTAQAVQGQHQAYFPGNIYQGQIELVTPDGQHLKSRPLGLSYFDGKNSVLIAELKDSVGVVVGNNQVIYADAFTDFKADLRYTYTKAGFEQDVILRQQPPTPESFGLNPDTARLEVLTEFFAPPKPTLKTTTLPAQAGLALADQSLGFGAMQMIPGRAFLLGANATDAGVSVSKQWQMMDGRQFLVEAVPVDAILEGLAKLPLTAMNASPNKSSRTASKHLVLPPQRLAKNDSSKTMLMAKTDLPTQGFVLDYQTVNSSLTNYTFQGDTTYYISGAVGLYGKTIFEGGAVIKYAGTNAPCLRLYPSVFYFQTSPYRPAIFTTKDDNALGETISGSTGNPATQTSTYLEIHADGYYGTPVRNARFLFAGTAIAQSDYYNVMSQVWDCQFIKCGVVFRSSPTYSPVGSLEWHNVLMAQCDVGYTNTSSTIAQKIVGEQVTADQVGYIASMIGYNGPNIYLTNSILTAVGPIHPFGGGTLYLNHSTQQSSATGVFQSVGSGSYYLATGSTNQNGGTAAISPAMLAELKQKTTYPPIVFSNVTISVNTTLSPQAQRDTDIPDLGYHYDPIDYLVDQFAITNATLTLTNGVAIASYNDTGIWLQDGSSIVSIGSPLYPNWFARYSSVQEQSLMLGSNPSSGADVNPYHYNVAPSGQFRFTKFACPAGGGGHLYDNSTYWFYTNLLVQDCEFWGGGSYFGGNTNTVATIKNNLFWRSLFQCTGNFSNSLSISDNLFWHAPGKIMIAQPDGSVWYVFNNIFDTCWIAPVTANSTCTNGYNAYINSTNRLNPNSPFDLVLSNALVYQTGPLGSFYQPTNSPLIDVGSTTADQVGLYHYTTQTNQVKETNSVVDIGYHYVATDAYGNPIDTNNNGVPDYLEDANGNGLVDSGEVGWNITGDLGLKVLIIRPRNGSNLP